MIRKRRYPWLSWDVWFELTQTQGVKPAGTLRFSHYDQLMQAAIDGQGIALGRSRFVSNWVKLGRLILPFGKRYMASPGDSRAYFIVPARGAALPRGRRILALAAGAGTGGRCGYRAGGVGA